MNNQEVFEAAYPRVLKRHHKSMEEPLNVWEEIPDTVVDLVLSLRASVNGSSDPMSKTEIRIAVAILQHRLDNWTESRDKIDEMIFDLISEGIRIGVHELVNREWDFDRSIDGRFVGLTDSQHKIMIDLIGRDDIPGGLPWEAGK